MNKKKNLFHSSLIINIVSLINQTMYYYNTRDMKESENIHRRLKIKSKFYQTVTPFVSAITDFTPLCNII